MWSQVCFIAGGDNFSMSLYSLLGTLLWILVWWWWCCCPFPAAAPYLVGINRSVWVNVFTGQMHFRLSYFLGSAWLFSGPPLRAGLSFLKINLCTWDSGMFSIGLFKMASAHSLIKNVQSTYMLLLSAIVSFRLHFIEMPKYILFTSTKQKSTV